MSNEMCSNCGAYGLRTRDCLLNVVSHSSQNEPTVNNEKQNKRKLGLGGIAWWHSIFIPGYGYTEGVVNYVDMYGKDWASIRFGMPKDLTGKHILDIGAWDGLMSFEAEARGAESVLAVDCPENEGGTWAGSDGFKYAKDALKSKVTWQPYNVETNKPTIMAQFDVVLCYGVLYHLKSPLMAMYHLAALTAPGGTCIIETAISIEAPHVAILQYKPRFEGDPTNYLYPNDKWIQAASKEVGFISCKTVYTDDVRATFVLSKGDNK